MIATGGGGRLHYQGFPTTNHYGATADGLVLAYRVGAKLLFIDTMQYHPTGAAFPQQILGLLAKWLVNSLALSLITGEPMRIESIRARRSKPGLLRQHLTAVQAAAEVGGALPEQ